MVCKCHWIVLYTVHFTAFCLGGPFFPGHGVLSRKSPVGRVNMRTYNFFVCGPRFAKFLTTNVGRVVVDQLLFRFSLCWDIPELFALKVNSCQKSRRILDFLALQNFLWAPLPKVYPPYHACLVLRRLVYFRKVTPTNGEVIATHTLNFKPSF